MCSWGCTANSINRRVEELQRFFFRQLDTADPVESVFEQRSDGGVVLGAGNENAMVGFDQLPQLEGVLGDTRFIFQITVVDGERIVGEADCGYIRICDCQMLCHQCSQHLVVGPFTG